MFFNVKMFQSMGFFFLPLFDENLLRFVQVRKTERGGMTCSKVQSNAGFEPGLTTVRIVASAYGASA